MGDRSDKRGPALEPAPDQPERASADTPLDLVLKHSIATSPERRIGRLQEVARRQERQRSVAQRASQGKAPPSIEQRQASRDHRNQEARTQSRQQYAMALRTFERLQHEILSDGRYLQNAGFVAEYSYWKTYFQSATGMDSQTFQRFTFWHSRFTQQARSTGRPAASYTARRPDWRTLNEMLRVCEATANLGEIEASPEQDEAQSKPSALNIGAGLMRAKLMQGTPGGRGLAFWFASKLASLL